ncbi:hypothetical protein ABZP36_029031 [Zizania latifolia]
MRKLGIGKVMDCFSFSFLSAGTCLCMRTLEDEEEAAMERRSLVSDQVDQVIRLRDLVDGTRTLGYHLEPKTVELKVSMHCNGCARKVQKHISKMEGVTWFEVDLESKKVVVMGDVTPFEVLQSISKWRLSWELEIRRLVKRLLLNSGASNKLSCLELQPQQANAHGTELWPSFQSWASECITKLGNAMVMSLKKISDRKSGKEEKEHLKIQ